MNVWTVSRHAHTVEHIHFSALVCGSVLPKVLFAEICAVFFIEFQLHWITSLRTATIRPTAGERLGQIGHNLLQHTEHVVGFSDPRARISSFPTPPSLRHCFVESLSERISPCKAAAGVHTRHGMEHTHFPEAPLPLHRQRSVIALEHIESMNKVRAGVLCLAKASVRVPFKLETETFTHTPPLNR